MQRYPTGATSGNSRPFSPLPRGASLPPLSFGSSCRALLQGTGRVRAAESRGGRSGPPWVPPRGSHQHQHFQAEQVSGAAGHGAATENQCRLNSATNLALEKDPDQHLMRRMKIHSCIPPPDGQRDPGGAPSPSPGAAAAPHSPVGEPRQVTPALQHQRRVEPPVAESRRGDEAVKDPQQLYTSSRLPPWRSRWPPQRCHPDPPVHNKRVIFFPPFTA